jgi:hypothetical protein
VEVCVCNTSTKISSNLAPFGKISKSGDSGHSGGIFSIEESQVNKSSIIHNNNTYDLNVDTVRILNQ